MRWWILQLKNEVQKLIFQSLPIFISWNLWKNKCTAKYRGSQSSTSRIKFLIFNDTTHLLTTIFPYIQWPNNWKDLFIMIERCRPEMKITPVTWIKPPTNIYKFNTDGSAIENLETVNGGGILRDHKGVMIYAFTVPLGI